MKHSYEVDGFSFRLRPIRLDDAEFIISLRADPKHSRFLNPTSTSVSEQHAYLTKLFERAGDYSFVLEHAVTRQKEGLAAICDVTADGLSAEWGRWILRPGSLAGPICVYLVYKVAFELLQLETLHCRTVLDNTTVVTFHDQFGLRRGRVLPGYFQRDGVSHDSIEHYLTHKDWAVLKQQHAPLLSRLGKRLAG